jgi:DNA-binding transcriptional MocR family regulator
MEFAQRLQNVETLAIREWSPLPGKPGFIRFSGGFPDLGLFDAEGIRQAADAVPTRQPGAVLQHGATDGNAPPCAALSGVLADRGARVASDGLIATTGSLQAMQDA